MLTTCVLYVSLGSSITPNIFRCVLMGSGVLSICRCSLVLYFVGPGVNSVQGVLSVLSMRLLSFINVCNCCVYVVCVDVMVMSSLYKVSCSIGGCGMSHVYMLVRGRLLDGHEYKNLLYVHVYYLKVVYALSPL